MLLRRFWKSLLCKGACLWSFSLKNIYPVKTIWRSAYYAKGTCLPTYLILSPTTHFHKVTQHEKKAAVTNQKESLEFGICWLLWNVNFIRNAGIYCPQAGDFAICNYTKFVSVQTKQNWFCLAVFHVLHTLLQSISFPWIYYLPEGVQKAAIYQTAEIRMKEIICFVWCN